MPPFQPLRLALVVVSTLLLPGCPQIVTEACGLPDEVCCAGSTCHAGAECGERNLCRACGGESEACCADGCRGGLRCEGGTCQAPALCGAEGESCCSGTSCLAGLRCDNASCVKPCGAGCAPGDKRCGVNGGVDLCSYDVAPCTIWSELIARCPSGQSCQAGVCIETCPGACVLQSTLCTTEGLKICELDTSTGCPVFKVAAPDGNAATCMTGACDGPICWESPVPQGNGLMGITGWDAEQLMLLDLNGNVIRRNAASWGYDRRAQPGEAFAAVANCLIPTRAFGVGSGGRAWVRNSLGWQQESVGDSSANLTAVACDPNSRAIAAGAGGKAFARGEDGIWRALATGTTKSFTGAAYDPFTGNAWLVGPGGLIVRCGPLYDPSRLGCAPEAQGLVSVDLLAAWAAVDGEAFAVGQSGTVLRRATNGIWSQVAQSKVSADLLSVHGLQNGRIYVGGANGAFLHRIGTDWYSESFTSEEITGIHAVDDANLFVVTRAGTIWFNDAGGIQGPEPQQHWRKLGGHLPTRASLTAVSGAGTEDLYAVGFGGAVLHRSDDAWRTEAQGLTQSDLFAVTWVSADEVYAFGLGGTVLARRAGTWTREAAGVTGSALFASWSDGKTVYAAGEGGVWLEKPVGAGAQHWKQVPQAATQSPILAMAGRVIPTTGQTEVYAVGAGCTLLKKVNGVFSAESVPGCAGQALFAIAVAGDGEMYVAGEDARLLHRVGGTWQREYVGTTLETIHALARNGDDVWAVAETGELYHRTAGTWRREAANLTWTGLRGVFAAAEGDVFIVGNGGLIWHRR